MLNFSFSLLQVRIRFDLRTYAMSIVDQNEKIPHKRSKSQETFHLKKKNDVSVFETYTKRYILVRNII